MTGDLELETTRRELIVSAGSLGAAIALSAEISAQDAPAEEKGPEPLFKVSLAQWSLHRTIRKGEIDNLGFAEWTKTWTEVDALEYVNSFFKDKATDFEYLGEMKKRATDNGMTSLLIMCDGEGALGDPDAKKRRQAVENHFKWIVAAKYLGCHSIRVNAQSSGEYEEQQRLAADGLHQLCEMGDEYGINVIVENHGGLSSNGAWLAGVMKMTDHKRVGTLPDFGNFRVGEGEYYDRYKGVAELMPYAKAVSAKSYDFNDRGDDDVTDYRKMMRIVVDAGYRGYVGIEYEGSVLEELPGIRKTEQLLRRVHREMQGS
jgi:L-ribulose-5-phosphate 3-epimerase